MFELTEARCMCGILDSRDIEEGGDGESIKDLHDGAGRGGRLHYPKRHASSSAGF
jgi:hypothetical protein